MINRFITFSIIIILSLSVIPAVAQTDSLYGYAIQHFTDENGLPQNSINDLLFDNDGFLWLASQVGLIRFTGSSFKLYYPDDKPVMESNIGLLGKDTKGNIYFQTTDHHLYCYPGNNSHLLSPVNTPALQGPWLLNSRKQLFNFTHFLHPGRPGEDTAKQRLIFRDLFDRNENFYADDSIHCYLLYNDSLYYYDNSRLLGLSVYRGNSLQYFSLEGKFYVMRQDSVLSIYSHGRKTGGSFAIGGDLALANNRSPDGHGGHPLSFRLFTGDTNLLLRDNELYQLSAATDGRINAKFLLRTDFASHITRIEYNAGLRLLLVATETDGFYFLRKSPFQTPYLPAPLRQEMSQYLFGPMALYQGKEILTDEFSFYPDGRFTKIKGIAPVWQNCLYIDRKDSVWSAVYNLPRQLSARMKPGKIFPALDGQIVDYKEDDKGQLYCLTENCLWRRTADSFHRVFNNAQLSLKGPNQSLCLAGPHRFWIANIGGLTEYDPESGAARTIPLLEGAHVRCISKCRDGSILLGTYGQGFFYYYHDHFFRMPLDKNGFLITAHSFLEDPKGLIWIPCNKGLFKVPKADLDAWCASDSPRNQIYYYYYGRQDGLPTNEFNGGFNASGVITRDGFVSLLTMKGMIAFYTDSLFSDFPQGSADITNIEIDGRSCRKMDKIELQPDYNSLLVEISCPFLGNRNNLLLQYCLKGLNEDWKEVPDNGILNLSRLDPGDYILRVRKSNGFGLNNFQYKEWAVVVIPHFYRTSWFIVLSVIVLLALLIGLVQLWIKLRKNKKELQVKADTLNGMVGTLQDTVEKLEKSQKALLQTSKLREKLISLVIHDLRSPLRFLTMLAGDVHDNQENFSGEEIKERTYWVKKGANDIYNFSEDFLLWVTSQRNTFSISKREVHIRPLLQEIYDFFREQVQQKGNSIFYEAAETLTIYSDPHILITIIRNLVDNANKYTDRGTIRITAAQEESFIVITVSDTGKGMSPQQIENFFQHDNLDDLRSGSQLGHRFIFDLTKRINGIVSIDSREQEGTTVRLRFSKEKNDEPPPAGEGSEDPA